MRKKFTFLFAAFFLMAASFVQAADVNVSGTIDTEVTWTKDNTYFLNGFVFVAEGGVLTIEAGTVIKGQPGQNENASALVVKRGGQIFANGTETEPIIFTTANDADLQTPVTVRGEWGGLIILGFGTHNNLTTDNEIEGVPASEEAYYGGNKEDDNSGKLSFVSIRHGGTELAPDEEINGLTLGAVGSATEISHVEVVANLDDGVEWFGGAPKCDHLLVAYCGDDAYDYDEGYHGLGQFWVALQTPGLGDNLGEHDGGPSSNRFGTPVAHPIISNVTYIGRGDGGRRVLTMRDYAGGEYHNSIFARQERGVRFEYVDGSDDVWSNLDQEKIVKIQNSTFIEVGGNDKDTILRVYEVVNDESVLVEGEIDDKVDSYFDIWNNQALGGITIDPDNPVPSDPSIEAPFYAGLDAWFIRANFRGAFDPSVSNAHWAGGWSKVYGADTYSDVVSLKPAEETIVTTADIAGNTNWTKDKVYLLDGFVFVEDGDVLNIEAGTVIKGLPGQNENASALIVKRGGKIFANGTADQPIVFTTANDFDLTMPATIRGEWGGVIILGRGTHNNLTNDNEIEGVPADAQAYYGGSDENDNSGELNFVSIRHGGSELAPDEEINGLTLGAVGAGTKISHVEVSANLDDGVEWFGGAPQCTNMLVAYCGDDAYDYDEGYHGFGQFWLAVQDAGLGDNCGEHDGGPSSNRFGEPFAKPVISNVTYIGRGDGGRRILTMRDYAGGEYHNSMFVNQERGIRVEWVDGSRDSWYQLDTAGNLAFANNVFYNVASNNKSDIFTVYNADDVPVPSAVEDKMDSYFDKWNNMIASSDPGVTKDNPVPSSSDAGFYIGMDSWFARANFKGAFDPAVTGGHWAGGWSFTYADDSYDGTINLKPAGDVTVTTDDIAGETTWSKDFTYFLDGFVFVEDGDVLNIEAGTVIKGLPGQNENASALIVKRGGVIKAAGTASEPITFTSSTDLDLTMPESIRGEWGGLIILGRGTHNNLDNNNEIEGVPAAAQAYYGGSDEDDNSGFLNFVSIRHGGTELAPDEEINGLTLGAVGAGTEISHVEVIANLDDGFEWFGGAPQCKHLLAAFCGDDAYDYDEGYHGLGQFWVAVQDAGLGDNCGEHDGGPSSNRFGEPIAKPIISNVTYIGRGDGGRRILTMRDYAGGEYHNSVFVNQDNGIRVEWVDGQRDSWYQLDTAGNLAIANNLFWNVAGNTEENIFTVYNADDIAVPSVVEDKIDSYFAAWGNEIATSDIGVTKDDPVPSIDVGMAKFEGMSDWFYRASFRGAFDPNVNGHWAGAWTYTFQSTSYNAELGNTVSIDENIAISLNVYPNPVVDYATVSFDNSTNDEYSFVLYNTSGQIVKRINGINNSEFTFSSKDLETGVYLYELRSNTAGFTGKLMIK